MHNRNAIVQPRKVNGKPLTVKDEHNRVIPWKEKGHNVVISTFISRIINDGDLLLLFEDKFLTRAEIKKIIAAKNQEVQK